MATSIWVVYALGAATRLWVINTSLASTIKNSVEVSTPMNSWKRVTEGVHLYQQNINPYSGSIFHETPLGLHTFNYMIRYWNSWLPLLFVLCDLFTAWILSEVAKTYSRNLLARQAYEMKSYASDTASLIVREAHILPVPVLVASLYLLNPYSIASCVGMTTTVLSNVLVAFSVMMAIKGWRLISTLFLALASYQGFYQLVLLAPLAMVIAEEEANHKGVQYDTLRVWQSIIGTVASFLVYITILLVGSAKLEGDYLFLEAVYGSWLLVPDLSPNIGLFWYFFTEMFDHFHQFFLCVFQINTFIYMVPLSVRLRKDPMLLFVALSCLLTVFKSYPSVGDVGFYISLLPMFQHLYHYMRQLFLAGGIFLTCTVLGPITRYLWLYAGSANSNFYFSITLAFSTGQIFVLTDLLFAYIRREYHLYHGLKLEINGKPTELAL